MVFVVIMIAVMMYPSHKHTLDAKFINNDDDDDDIEYCVDDVYNCNDGSGNVIIWQ